MDLMYHAGLGDNIICNAIVRNFCKEYEFINIFVNSNNYVSIEFMFRDIKNLNYIIWNHNKKIEFEGYFDENSSDFYKWYQNNLKNGLNGTLNGVGANNYSLQNKKIIRITNNNTNINFDRSFYECAGLDFNKRWDDFYVDRDIQKEICFFEKFNISGEKFIFLHEGGSSGMSKINRKKISNDLPIIEAKRELTDNIFDYCYIIENAAEIHCVDSSFLFLTDSIKTNGDLFVHRYTKKLSNSEMPTLRKNWNIM